ncbi:thermonuclease family protein [Mycoplasma phocimorsus]|uniref:Thermonuclease family protein n=1 Tax=Mycoplasma phocimorsus TaxID=3045839 RepID=A0AAJ1UZA7_9MOLU|nr:thermonuclease family protein [Mycoplasma phocimorsus]MDJ1645538.1 thermonuclease family protein [Mycoplasma phocimorsus]MDJ1646619.1 thermonuclease family protein [Mycoplasma phocimorsus]MDJ1647107.1 thermonuclease family protein [Mycoplasma phocimorsus]MDJ1648973.1 thermonuclease family protein [Mycoplasma phocimorsus]
MKLRKILQITSLFFIPLIVISCSQKEQIKENVNQIKPNIDIKIPKKYDQTIKVLKVVDGDTFYDSQGNKYRMLGIDTPEKTKQTDNGKESTLGLQHHYALKAQEFLSNKILNKDVQIINITLDHYGRKVVQVFINDEDLSILLVKNGLAKVAYISKDKKSRYYFKDTSYVDVLSKAQQEAMIMRLNIWSDLKKISQIYPRKGH